MKESDESLYVPNRTIIVLDDDPTGTQTVHDVPVLTSWSEAVLGEEFSRGTPLFFILTNSRSLQPQQARELALTIGQNIQLAASQTGREVQLISRSDSTLRGHYPVETDALAEGIGWPDHLTVLIPAFFEGHRFTRDDTHYLAESDTWVPVAETPYARDKTFGYQSSNLKDWVAEKTGGTIPADTVDSLSIDFLQRHSLDAIRQAIERAGRVLIVNATDYATLNRFSRAAETASRSIIYRTGASFVASFGRIVPRPLLTADTVADPSGTGGLIVVGSHVPKTSAQLAQLFQTPVYAIEAEVGQLLTSDARTYVQNLVAQVNYQLAAGETVVLYTSRLLQTGNDEAESLRLSTRISDRITDIISTLSVRPRFLIAKGGITSSDVATKGLGVKRAIVRGQLLPGVPVWQLGSESKFPGMSYVVFPGNVGADDALRVLYEKLTAPLDVHQAGNITNAAEKITTTDNAANEP